MSLKVCIHDNSHKVKGERGMERNTKKKEHHKGEQGNCHGRKAHVELQGDTGKRNLTGGKGMARAEGI